MPEVFFTGPAGRIEGRYTKSANPKAPLALLLHPHPLHGGTMNNKIVYSLYKILAKQGFTTLRINFRGVGRSQGSFDEGVGEMVDATSALDWIKNDNPSAERILVGGFSFGARIAAELVTRRPDISEFIIVAPPVNKYDFTFFSPCPVPGIVIQGDQDSIAPEREVFELAQRLSKHKSVKVEYRVVSGADHFFRDKITELENLVSEYLEERFGLASFVENNMIDLEETISEKKLRKAFLD